MRRGADESFWCLPRVLSIIGPFLTKGSSEGGKKTANLHGSNMYIFRAHLTFIFNRNEVCKRLISRLRGGGSSSVLPWVMRTSTRPFDLHFKRGYCGSEGGNQLAGVFQRASGWSVFFLGLPPPFADRLSCDMGHIFRDLMI